MNVCIIPKRCGFFFFFYLLKTNELGNYRIHSININFKRNIIQLKYLKWKMVKAKDGNWWLLNEVENQLEKKNKQIF